tara:strand:+ start:881 stop:1714 length:834 start_codon:yes stop_codon:yes gene_type:complete
MLLSYKINNFEQKINASEQNIFSLGPKEILSNKSTDPTFNQPWYNEGFKVFKAFDSNEFSLIKHNIKRTIIHQLERENIDTTNFDLEKYHDFVQTDIDHFKIVSRTRDLFNEDFYNPIINLKRTFSNQLGFKLTDKDPTNGKRIHIIIRIIRPFQNDYNPPHKDIYELVDKNESLIKMINFWIPICGLTNEISLPVVPFSHLLNENKILRTRKGGIINGKEYNVRLIKSWNSDNNLIRPPMEYGDTLIFSSHLIHGIATNNQKNRTRISLEFRLVKK